MLMVTEGRVETMQFDVDGEVLIGRVPPAEVLLDGATVSRSHCWLRVDDDGRLSVEDAGSTTGMFMNDERFSGAIPFDDNDELRIGLYRLKVMTVTPIDN
jgi:pSer/pThr/pTyr-binding forkhead associated (FHA) protein